MKLGINIMHNEWKNMLLEECIIGKAACGANIKAEEYDPTLPRYLRITNIDNDGNLIAHSIKSINPSDAKKSYLQKGDIVFARSGSIGKTYLHRTDEIIAYAGYLIRLRPNHNIILSEYLFLLTQSDQYKASIKHTIQGAIQCNINVPEYLKLSISVPLLSEQQKIVSVLRTWEKAISVYQLYLNSLQKRRQLITQKMLNNEKWSVVSLAEIADIIVSNVDKKTIAGQKIVKLCNYMDVFKNRYITSDFAFMKATASDHEICIYTLKKGDAVFTKDSETAKDIAVCASIEEDIKDLVCGYHLAIARPKSNKILGTYLAEAINSSHVHKQFTCAANGITRFGLIKSDINNIKLSLPSLNEQEKIIRILRQCDREKELIIQKIKKIKNQKQGLMQKLLTGQWRVKVNEEVK